MWTSPHIGSFFNRGPFFFVHWRILSKDTCRPIPIVETSVISPGFSFFFAELFFNACQKTPNMCLQRVPMSWTSASLAPSPKSPRPWLFFPWMIQIPQGPLLDHLVCAASPRRCRYPLCPKTGPLRILLPPSFPCGLVAPKDTTKSPVAARCAWVPFSRHTGSAIYN